MFPRGGAKTEGLPVFSIWKQVIQWENFLAVKEWQILRTSLKEMWNENKQNNYTNTLDQSHLILEKERKKR